MAKGKSILRLNVRGDIQMSWMKIVTTLTELVTFCLLLDNIWEIPKNKDRIFVILNFGAVIVFSCLIGGIEWGMLLGFVYHLAFFVIVFLRYKSPLKNKIVLSIIGIILLNLFELCIGMIAELCASLFNYTIDKQDKGLVVGIILCIIFGIMWVKNKDVYLFDFNAPFSQMLMEMFGCFIFLICAIILSELFLSYDSLAKPAVIIFGALGYGGVLVGFILLYRLLISRKMYRQSSEFNWQQLLLKEEYYKKILDSQHEIKKIRHDIKNNLNTMNRLLSTDKCDEAKAFLGELLQEFNEIPKIFSVGNEIVDLIINDKFSKAAEKSIECSTEGMLPENLQMTTLDLCTLFSNLLDNAIEASEKVEKSGFIKLAIRTYNNEVMILLENSCTLADFAPTDKLKTTKKDSANHGYGTENIRSSIQKYGGRVTYECHSNVFCARIVINIIM